MTYCGAEGTAPLPEGVGVAEGAAPPPGGEIVPPPGAVVVPPDIAFPISGSCLAKGNSLAYSVGVSFSRKLCAAGFARISLRS